MLEAFARLEMCKVECMLSVVMYSQTLCEGMLSCSANVTMLIT